MIKLTCCICTYLWHKRWLHLSENLNEMCKQCLFNFQFNTTLSDVLTNLVHGEHCSRYQVTAIRGTNAFFGMVNETCTVMRAFCPCSMVSIFFTAQVKMRSIYTVGFCPKNIEIVNWLSLPDWSFVFELSSNGTDRMWMPMWVPTRDELLHWWPSWRGR